MRPSAGEQRTSGLAPEDLSALACQVVQGLQEHLREAMSECLAQLLQELALASQPAEHGPKIQGCKDAVAASTLIPTWGSQESQTLLMSARSACKGSRTETVSVVGQGHLGCPEPSFERTAHGQRQPSPEWPSWGLSWMSDFWGAPSGVANLGNAREKELLAAVPRARGAAGAAASERAHPWDRWMLQTGSRILTTSSGGSGSPDPRAALAPKWTTMPANLDFNEKYSGKLSHFSEVKTVHSDTACIARTKPAWRWQLKRRCKASKKVLEMPVHACGMPELSGVVDAIQEPSPSSSAQEWKTRHSKKLCHTPSSDIHSVNLPCVVHTTASLEQLHVPPASFDQPQDPEEEDPPQKAYWSEENATRQSSASPCGHATTPRPLRSLSQNARALIAQTSDTKKMQLEREEELLSCPPGSSRSWPPARSQRSPRGERRKSVTSAPGQSGEFANLSLECDTLEPKASTADVYCPSSLQSNAPHANPYQTETSERSHAYMPGACAARGAGTPWLLCICGILPWGRFGVAYRIGMQLLAGGLVAIFVCEFYEAQHRVVSHAECFMGVCLSFSYLSDILLAVGNLLGLWAIHTLTSHGLLGSPVALLVRFASEYSVAQKWSHAIAWQSIYLTILWLGSLAFRAATLPSEPEWLDVARACAFMVSSLIFVGLVYSILYVSCLLCSLLDTYANSIRATEDLAKTITEWDRLVALLRRVSRAVGCCFLLVQTTSGAMLLCSISDLVLLGRQQIWWFISTALLAQTLVLLFFKAAEVTEYCTRLPSIINLLDFQGDVFSAQKHYLIEHIGYSCAGFYVGEVRLTAGMSLKLMYVSILIGFGILSRLTMA